MKKLAFAVLLLASTAFAAGPVTLDVFPNGIQTPMLNVTSSLTVNGGSVTSLSLGTANGLSLSNGVLSLGLADGTHPGALDFNAQTIGGAKTFSSTISASNLSGTNSGDVTLGTSNGLSLLGQTLSLGAADATHSGALTFGTQAIGGTKNFATNITTLTDSTHTFCIDGLGGQACSYWNSGNGKYIINTGYVDLQGNLEVEGVLHADHAVDAHLGIGYVLQTLPTCAAGIEGQQAADVASGASTTHRTRLCFCTSNGSAVYAWQNTVSGTVGTTTTCAD